MLNPTNPTTLPTWEKLTSPWAVHVCKATIPINRTTGQISSPPPAGYGLALIVPPFLAVCPDPSNLSRMRLLAIVVANRVTPVPGNRELPRRVIVLRVCPQRRPNSTWRPGPECYINGDIPLLPNYISITSPFHSPTVRWVVLPPSPGFFIWFAL